MATTGQLAIDGGVPVRTKSWPAWPIWDETEEKALLDVLHSGQWWSIGGRKVPEFEAAFAEFQDAKHCIAVTNGTHAIEICLRALDIGAGDEVIVPPYTFIATASSVLAVGATPVFVDIEAGSFNMDPALIEAAITPQTKAVIPVHIAGCPADMEGVLAVARKHGLYVIEDAAQAVGAAWKGTRAGAIGDLGTFSFQASKNLNSGEGGAIVSNSQELADKVWSVHNVGRARGGRWYEHVVLGGNFRMTEWQAAILLAQMARLDEQIARRTACADRLTALLQDIPGITPLETDPRVTTHAHHLFIFRYDAAHFNGKSHADFTAALTAEGVPCSGGYVPLYKEAVFESEAKGEGVRPAGSRQIDYPNLDLPVCEAICKDTVWLGQQGMLAEPGEMEDIAAAIRKIQAAWT